MRYEYVSPYVKSANDAAKKRASSAKAFLNKERRKVFCSLCIYLYLYICIYLCILCKLSL